MIDLHIHSNYSGGKNNLIKILQIAEKRNVSIISITDNNTCEAYAELKELSEERFYSGKIIPGCEFSTIVIQIWRKTKYQNYIFRKKIIIYMRLI